MKEKQLGDHAKQSEHSQQDLLAAEQQRAKEGQGQGDEQRQAEGD